jgi:hypothetical protein
MPYVCCVDEEEALLMGLGPRKIHFQHIAITCLVCAYSTG